jgi:SAM-dependent methyltransferase
LARYRWATSFVSGREVLDAACGTGYGTKILAEAKATAVVGLDRSPEAVDEARKTAHPNSLFMVGDVTRLPFADHVFDVYLSFETFEHIEKSEALVEEARRILNPAGTFICSTPNRPVISPGHRLADRPLNPFHTREYDRDEFDSTLRRFFPEPLFYGQTFFSPQYISRLNRIGRKTPTLAVRIHQIRKILGVFRENEKRHRPIELPCDGEPEVLIAVCTTKS